MRQEPLPDDVLQIIRIAAGCEDSCREGVKTTGCKPDIIRSAAAHYLHTVMFFPEASSYRILGVSEDATHAVLLQHKHWLLRWLHPDHNRNVWEARLFDRVLKAWADVVELREQRADAVVTQTSPFAAPVSASPRANNGPRARPLRPFSLYCAPPIDRAEKKYLKVLAVISMIVLSGLVIFALEVQFESFWVMQASLDAGRVADGASGRAGSRPDRLQPLPALHTR
jgi:hypothetical protein